MVETLNESDRSIGRAFDTSCSIQSNLSPQLDPNVAHYLREYHAAIRSACESILDAQTQLNRLRKYLAEERGEIEMGGDFR